jgi:signal transduction histidine kinase
LTCGWLTRAADLPFICEPFRRGSNVVDAEGMGLGLASVWQTVKTHDGRLSIDSREHEGTRVTIRLPLEAGAVRSARSTSHWPRNYKLTPG